MKNKKLVADAWFKRKPYLHFDYALTKRKAVEYVKNPANVEKHGFSPFIYYEKISRRYKRDKTTRKLEVSQKPRNIFYASHVDGYIYSYYSSILYDKYEALLKNHDLDQNVIAYRRIEKNGQKYSNINFASEVFDYIKCTSGCNVLCLDIQGFFDKLSLIKLKEKWCQVLEVDRLPKDHYKVFWSLKKFHYVEEDDIIKYFGIKPRKHDIKEHGSSLRHRICDYRQLKSTNNDEGIIKSKCNFGITGIPQGSPISGLLANIFMIDFDLALKSFVESRNGCYRRYSDDIFIALPTSISFAEIETFVVSILNITSFDSLKIQHSKTEKTVYQIESDGNPVCLRDGKTSRVQYLGFTFDGNRIHIRNSSISRNKLKICEVVRKYKKGNKAINTRKVFKAQSRRKITPFDELPKKGFVYYAERASRIQQSEEIVNQIKKNDRFIKNKIRQERGKARNIP